MCCVCDLGRYVWVLCACFAVDRKGEFMIWRVTSEKIKQKCSIPTRDLAKITCKASVTKSKESMLCCTFFLITKLTMDWGTCCTHTHTRYTFLLPFSMSSSSAYTFYHLAFFEQHDLSYKQKKREMSVTLHSRVLVNQMNLVHRSK